MMHAFRHRPGLAGPVAALAALLLVNLSAMAQEPAWIGTWGASPLPPSPTGGPFPPTPAFEDQTLRQIVRISIGGGEIRLRLSNEYGTQPLAIGAARVALAAGANAIEPDSERVVTFGGEPTAVIAAGAPLLSDPIDLPVDDLAMLSISLYLPDATGACTCHGAGMQDMLVSASGDFTAGTFEPAQTLPIRAFLSGVDVRTRAAGAIVTLGDSITDGVGSTPGANRRWPDLLAERLIARGSGPRYGIVNQGISGNRVLSDGAGESALARFDRDVLAVPGVTHVIIFEGVNDLGFEFGRFEGPLAELRATMPPSQDVTTETMIAGYRQLIARARSAGLEVYGATIAPYAGATYYSPDGEAIREAVNTWIRDGGEFDAVLDFDAVFRDPDAPVQMRDDLHAGDHLHGSDAGYRAVAESIDLSLF
jgi:lysophospholipase L1-like esterase